MKILSSLTTAAIVLLFVVTYGILFGQVIKNILPRQSVAALTPVSLNPPSNNLPSIPSITSQTINRVIQKVAPTVIQPSKVIPTEPPVVNQTTQVVPTDIPVQAPPPTDVPTQVPASIPVPTSPPADNRCIITISGSSYDVTQFRNIHSGGDIFNCGTDMTAIFLSQHPQSFLQRMSQYKI